MNKTHDTKEVLLNEEESRLTIHPIKYDKIWNLYKKMQKCFWTAEEIDFSKDVKDCKFPTKKYSY